MTSPRVRDPDDQEWEMLASLNRLAKRLMHTHGGSAFVVVVKPEGVAVQGYAKTMACALNAAHALLTFAAQVAEVETMRCPCTGCTAVSERIAGALEALRMAPDAAIPAQLHTHRVH